MDEPGVGTAQPVLVSSVPPNMASGVSPTASVVFTFSEAMNTSVTLASFMDTSNPMQPIATLPNWSGENKVLTCTPVVPWVGSHMIFWTLTGDSAGGMPLGTTNGLFTAAAASTGCDTNATMPSFTVSRVCCIPRLPPAHRWPMRARRIAFSAA